MLRLRNIYKNHSEKVLLLMLVLFTIGVLAITLRMNFFRYHNFDFGKFDLGNMTQMVWNTLHGRPLILTDYFGANVPRWAMSHVDPILLVFVPVFALYQHPLTLVFSQIILVLSSAFIIYKLAKLELESPLAAVLFAFAFLFYPAVGFLNAWTGFHGVTAVIPFFIAAFYVYEKMHKTGNFTQKGYILFWLFLVLTMMGKEQLPLYIFFYGFFILVFRFGDQVPFPQKSKFIEWLKSLLQYRNVKTGLAMMVVGFTWFALAFFVIIPRYAHLRVAAFQEFAQELSLDTDTVNNVERANYFLSRYEAFGETYSEVIIGMVTNPKLLIQVSFGGDKVENLKQTLEPLAYTSILNPPLFIMALPDFLINYSTSAGGIGTAEIFNHRVSMIIPVLFISSIYAAGALYEKVTLVYKRARRSHFVVVFAGVVLAANVYTTFSYENPVYLWLTQAVQKRLSVLPVFAKTDPIINRDNFEVGERLNLSKLDTKDRECASKIVNLIPDEASVSGPDYLGAHLAMRETYAIFPVLYNKADYVIVDVFSQKILRILDLDVTLVRDVVGDIMKHPDYQLKLGCGNLFVFEKIGEHGKSDILPLQETFTYNEQTDLEIFQSLTIANYTFPDEITRGKNSHANFAYVKREEESLDGYVLFLTFVNKETKELYQVANLPSFALHQLRNWKEDRYYLEDIEVALPEFLDPGTYNLFIGMSNEIRTRSIYLKDVEVR